MNTEENRWYPVARADDLPMRHVFQSQLHGIELALWRADDNRVNAWENRCPHRSVRFTLGVNTGKKLRCQYHGWQYQSGDGRCTFIPATSDMAPPASVCARTFEAKEVNGYIWARVNGFTLPDADAVAASAATVEPLPLSLRSLSFNAWIDVVIAELACCADYDVGTVPGSCTFAHNDEGIDLAWKTESGARELRFWLQPAERARTIVHCSAKLEGMEESEALRWCNRLLTMMRRRAESTQQQAASLARAESAVKPRVIPIFQNAVQNKTENNRSMLRTTVVMRWQTAEDIVAFKLALPHGANFDFEAGAHLDVYTPSGFMRQYSLVNAPEERNYLVIGVKLEPESRGGSRSLHESLRVGDSLTVSAPKNHFPLVSGKGGVLIAGGIGITPILAMGAALKEADLPCTLHYFVRSNEHVAFMDRLSELDEVQLHVGMAVDAVAEAVDAALISAGSECHIYVCGPRPLIDLVSARADQQGISKTRIHFELFANEVSHDSDTAFRVRLQSNGIEFSVPPGLSLSDALAAHGVAINTSCEQGVCGTCRTEVLEGEPEHRDVYLNDEEKKSGRCMMPCVSRSRTELLVLDL